ncbi:hypothetical protein BDW02DRAFT_597022 [Decorospora gaudefroyi]|uniref:Uncharacterized protein n=1 Tax=Decorospora gaudefroyi TaxID=184978 RepID=A0A6A5KJM0_9PLEO|nr:hypothetical protein BDW02DRAFT_597022 [Decorospora gaudefroyi]
MENAINSRQNDKDSPEHTDRSRRSKKAKLNHTTVTGPATTSSTPSEKLPSVQNAATASPAPHRNQSYPNIRDKEAWRELAKSTDTAARSQHAETYRRLRKAHKSKESRWGRVVQRELEDLGLVDSVVRDGAKTPPKSGDKGVNGVKDDAAVVYKIVEEDEFDIDIYGDEETRRKYEPWIKSLEAEK